MEQIIQRTDQNITPNTWLLNVIKSLHLHLDGQCVNVTLRYDKAQNEMAALKLATGYLLQQLDPDTLHGVKIEPHPDCDMGNYQTDLVIRIDYSDYKKTDPYNRDAEEWDVLGKLIEELTEFSITDISLKNWDTIDPIEIKWVDYALRITIPFESAGEEVVFKKVCIEQGVHINGFKIHINLVPYIFWVPDVTFPKDKNGVEYQFTPVAPNEDEYCFRTDAKELYKQACTLFLDFEWTNISPNKILGKDIPKLARNALKNLSKSLSKSVPQRKMFNIFEQIIIKENELNLSLATNLGSSDLSWIRGVDIKPDNARFLYFDEEHDAPEFEGRGKIIRVRKCSVYSELNKSGVQTLRIDKRYKPDNIIEVEIEKEDGKLIRINVLNLVESILKSRRESSFVCEIKNAHVVIRTRNWGHVTYTKVPWRDLLTRESISNWGMQGITNKERLLKYPGYMRDNPDNSKKDNLDNLPKYAYSFTDPLYRNVYNGLLFFVLASRKYGKLQRTLFLPKWKLPDHEDRVAYQLTDEWIERSR